LRQFSVHPQPRSGGYLLNVQADLLEMMATRLVIPLISKDTAPLPLMRTLNPTFHIFGCEYALMTQNMVSIPMTQLAEPVGSLAAQREHIDRAIDALLDRH
jgi:toxin CcdB